MEVFYEDITKAMKGHKSKYAITAMGDFNAKVGKQQEGKENMLVKFGS